MATPVTPPRGMRDFLPADKASREHALAVIRHSFTAHGFDEIETPVMEDSARLHSGLGGDNEKLAFAVMKRGLKPTDVAAAAESGDLLALADLGLRFDLTVPLARFYATHRSELPTVFRSIQIAPVWRAERPQKGRYRQFVQCDIDIIGEAGMLAEIELITATSAALDALGLTGCSIRINDRRILAALLAHWNVPADLSERALITIDKLDKIGVDGVVAELGSLGLVTAGIAETLTALGDAGWDAAEPVAPAWLDQDAYGDLLALRAAMPGVRLDFDPTLVRGMGYYTGTIFEISHPTLGYSLGGGGRYDGMIGRFLGTDVPACGFSIGFERIVDLLGADAASVETSVVLVYDKGTDPARLVALKQTLVAEGLRVRLEQRTKNVKALLERAAAGGYGRYAFVAAATEDVAALDFRPLAG
ncbi:histidine--tRNA ligase [Cryobacterium sp. TMT1-21]|uniref:Histidine--tRNA ligase n=1 Tax=Cryobacterium shii TaxID=1259235 RepID=A0AAQ2C5Q0_9MICO|nr:MULTISPECIES: histidine--tRNA ligase [Cryobacterium]TFC45515.1 histidine--tRNA ligase [Cryobacterium shii]TFC80926.1 histidine--tRNA ligase [Cryobacterium sp. TmT2-59]TFD11385.1 histidine--tRNA ligase [Cryobacterium sp. TMT1-21]TFD18797.1 histidine--tRNA ligase [Cryobacterium sp. TMT2-23]TFD18876.1 histidine--tRNA ligase [Cryobacterium sp. TMT4-10]